VSSPTLLVLLAQLALILSLARAMGALFQRLGQPSVIGEILAGILLGPSLLGWIAPRTVQILFPQDLLLPLQLLAQLGLILFLFIVGVELDRSSLSSRFSRVLALSLSGIALPMMLGVLLAAGGLYKLNGLPDTSFAAFALCVSVAMAITAFPVLASILADRKLLQTPLGSLALSCASIDDVCTWCLLALTIVLHRGGSLVGALPILVGVVLFAAAMAVLMPPLGGLLLRWYRRRGLDAVLFTTIVVLVLLCAMVTERIGIDVIFGAFLFGALLPRDADFLTQLRLRCGEFASLVLLPVFFALSGLSTDLRLLLGPVAAVVPLVIGLAILGKFCGIYGAARLQGVDSRSAWNLGWLMNSRGLTELIVLNIGLRLGIISPLVFGLFVVMALVTTVITGPLLRLAPAPSGTSPPAAAA
jgi:Kef-type K+ transport system membrane component KefB